MKEYKSNIEDTGSVDIYKQNFDGLRDDDDYEAQKRLNAKRNSSVSRTKNKRTNGKKVSRKRGRKVSFSLMNMNDNH